MKIINSIDEMQKEAEDIKALRKTIGFVPTMGYLHEGHLSLVRKARELSDVVVVSIFVNPTQFGPNEDLDRYPRDFERDRSLLEQENTDIIFYPEAKDMYPKGYCTYVQVRGMEDFLCGKSRKGHFIGVATIVTKLFNIVKPHYAVFGLKDYQQYKIIERMVKDLNMDIKIIAHPTVREKDGLAMSSRNTYLSHNERKKALKIYESINTLKEMVKSGVRDGETLRKKAKEILESEEGIKIDYISISDTETLEELSEIKDKALYAVACFVGKTRLIDNTILEV
ncbi:MAG TPA: pantoate--beta-alanine ligase [Syntrophorhabdaceae bacterium]|nr:pantoate--beta-alanine ligase [Syntrophorhabdaceae bacterium]